MIFNFSNVKNKLLNDINNKFNKIQFKSSNSFRTGVLPNILFQNSKNEIHKRITYTDRIEKIDDYMYRWYLNDDSKQIVNVKQILDLSFNYQYIPLKIEDDHIDFSTFPNKDIYTYYHTTSNKRSTLLIKYDEIDREYLIYPKTTKYTQVYYGKMMDVNELELLPKFKEHELFKISIYSLLDKPSEHFIQDLDKQLIYYTMIFKDGKLYTYKKYFKTYDSVSTNYDEYFENINNSSRFIFESNDIQDETRRLKYLNKTKSDLGINNTEMSIYNSSLKTVKLSIDNRWEIKIDMLDDFRIRDITKNLIISIPILNIPTSNNIYPYFKEIQPSNYIDGVYDTDSLLNKRDNLMIVENKWTYDGGSF